MIAKYRCGWVGGTKSAMALKEEKTDEESYPGVKQVPISMDGFWLTNASVCHKGNPSRPRHISQKSQEKSFVITWLPTILPITA